MFIRFLSQIRYGIFIVSCNNFVLILFLLLSGVVSFSNVTFDGEILNTIRKTSFQECIEWCLNRTKCVSLTYMYNSDACFLHKNVNLNKKLSETMGNFSAYKIGIKKLQYYKYLQCIRFVLSVMFYRYRTPIMP